MWNGKKKAITFSFDDGMVEDIWLVNLFKKYGLKGTFNINSGLFSQELSAEEKGRMTKEEFIKRAKEKHGDKYDYSFVEYINSDSKVKIYVVPTNEELMIAKETLRLI